MLLPLALPRSQRVPTPIPALRPMCLCSSHASCAPHGSGWTGSKQKRERRDRQPVKRPSDHSIHASLQASHLPLLYCKWGQSSSRSLHCYSSLDQPLDATSKPKVVGLGSVGLDYLAQVVRFPKPDEKLRTEKMEVLYQAQYTGSTDGAVIAG